MYITKQSKKCNASIYNGNVFFPITPFSNYNVIITTEKLSKVKFMKDVADGKVEHYQLGVDYRLFTNKWHISYPIYSNLISFIKTARNNFKNIELFFNRKNSIVYIQRVNYKMRQYLVKEIMKNYEVHSFGKDMNNKKWPDSISKSNKIEILKKYKYCLAIENSVASWKIGTKFEAELIDNDYVTEKLTDCFLAGCIPIYFGPRNVDYFLPHPTSIINMSSFNSIGDLIDYLNLIDTNLTILTNYFIWLYNYSKEWYNRYTYDYNFNYCKVCNYVKQYS